MDDYQLPSLTATEFLNDGLQGLSRLVDVRKPAAVRTSGRVLRGAEIIDPFTLNFQHALLRKKSSLVFYCVHGHEVSQFATTLALVAGCDAKYVVGGFDALVSKGAELVEIEE